jgi:hypothetical protein
MTRPLIVLGALVAGSACAVWAHVSLAPSAQRAAIAVRSEVARPAETQVISGKPVSHPLTAAPAVRASARTEPRARSEAMRVALDPATGQIAPPEYSGEVLSIEQMQALARRDAEGLVTVRNPDGSETLNHEGHFADYTIVRAGPDGRPVFVCVQGQGAASRVLHAAKPAQPKMEDR